MFIPKSSDVWSGKKIMKSKANRVVTTAMMVQTWEKSPKTRKRQKWRLDQHNKQTPYLEVTINIYFKFFKQADAPLGYWNGWTLMVSIHTIHLPQVCKNQHLQIFCVNIQWTFKEKSWNQCKVSFSGGIFEIP
jgi:hypothetical protein